MKISYKNRHTRKSSELEPISCGAVNSSIYDAPISSYNYGSFEESILQWIDEQVVPDWFSLDYKQEEWMPALYEMGVLFPLREPLKAKIFKKEVSKIVLVRRSRFNRKRDQYMLSMLHAGYPYICAHHCCSETLSLTIDHIIPLSKGGSDDLNNFQFLCQKHNSEKGASMPTKK